MNQRDKNNKSNLQIKILNKFNIKVIE